MNGFMAVLTRELRERWPVPVAAFGAGLIALAVPLFPTARLHPPDDVRAGAAMVLALAFGLGAALMLGGSVLASDLFEGRIGFYLARPISSFAIWAGKMAASITLALSGAALALLPAALAGASMRDAAVGLARSREAPVFAVAALLLVPLAHVGAVVLRSRSPLLLIDLLLLGATAILARAAYIDFLLLEEPAVFAVALALLAAGTAAGILLAGPMQVASGRSDLRRGRVALSLAFWAGTGLAVVSGLAWRGWVRSAGPEDLAVWNAQPAPRGDWMALRGVAKGRAGHRPTFLFNAADGRSLPIFGDAAFSADGRRVAWIEREDPRSLRGRLILSELTADGVSQRRTTVFAQSSAGLLLDPSGSKVAVFEDGTLSVFDEAGRQLFALRRKGIGWFSKGAFLSPNRLRVWAADGSNSWNTPASIEILDIDLATRKASLLGRTDPFLVRAPLLADAKGERILVRRLNEGIDLRDGESGAALARFADDQGPVLWADFLPDGRVAAVRGPKENLSLSIASRDGAVIREISLGPGGGAFLCGTAAPNILLIAVSGDEWVGRPPTRVLALDLDTGAVRVAANDLYPVTRWARFVDMNATRVPAPPGLAPRLFVGRGGSLVKLDPISGKRQTVLPGH